MQAQADWLESHLNQMGQDVLGVQRHTVQVSVLLDEVEQLRGIGHPESQRSCNILLLLFHPNHSRPHAQPHQENTITRC